METSTWSQELRTCHAEEGWWEEERGSKESNSGESMAWQIYGYFGTLQQRSQIWTSEHWSTNASVQNLRELQETQESRIFFFFFAAIFVCSWKALSVTQESIWFDIAATIISWRIAPRHQLFTFNTDQSWAWLEINDSPSQFNQAASWPLPRPDSEAAKELFAFLSIITNTDWWGKFIAVKFSL